MGCSSPRGIRDAYMRNVAAVTDLTVQPGTAHVDPALCRACGKCLKIGHCDAIEEDAAGKARVIKGSCTACSTCVDICPFGAITMLTVSR
jgi:Fe-S-cluster-containing hydrogenase component 2